MKKNLLIYLPALIIVLAVKVFYQTADSDALAWILTPTSYWVSILSGISFENVPHVGYVNHDYRFIIAASCSGVRFLLITFVMMVCSFTYRISSMRQKTLWLFCSAVLSYISTIFINGIRITVSIYLPIILTAHNLMGKQITAEQLHTIIGTSIYFSSLFIIYYFTGKLCSRFFAQSSPLLPSKNRHPFIAPVFWYFVMVLGLPFLVRLYRGDWEGFSQYALLVTGICALVTAAFFLLCRLRSLTFSLYACILKTVKCARHLC